MTSSENLAPRDAKVISIILRSLGIEECEPKVIIQLLELAYKYSTGVIKDAQLYADHCGRTTITVNDVKLALQSKVGKTFVPPPPRHYLIEIANSINSKPLSTSESCENMLKVPSKDHFFGGLEYEEGK